MLTNRTSQNNKRRAKESGQAAVFLVLAMGLFLIGSMGFVVDGANLWFHRQSAQTAADAACTAAAMDMLSHAAAPTPNDASWLEGLSPECPTGSSTIAPCSYAFLNGYSGSAVSVSPGTFTGLDDKDCDYSNPVCNPRDHDLVSSPYLQVVINDQIPMTFMRLLGAGPRVSVPTRSTCGLSNVLSAVPILVLNPNALDGPTFGGSGNLSVLGAPKSIQVNSIDTHAVDLPGKIDLSATASGTGDGEFAIAGRELESDAGASISAKWVNAAGVISDPFANISPPQQGQEKDCTVITDCVTYGAPVDTPGCPAGVSCDLYQAGYYPAISCPGSLGDQAAICVQHHLLDTTKQTGLAVFEPGVYYLAEDFYAGPDSCVRSATAGGDGSAGTIFYLSNKAVLNVVAGSGGSCAGSVVSVSDATCPGGNLNLPAGLTVFTGNVLLAPCTGKYGDPSGAGKIRGMLFFQERDVLPVNQATWSGSSSFALVGNVYLHNCHLDQSGDRGANCDPNAFQETLNLGSTGYIVGGIVVDQLHINSGANLNVFLNPNPQYYTLKASLLQ